VSISGNQTNYCDNGLNDTLIGLPLGGTFFGTGMINNEFDRKENALKLCEWLTEHNCTSLIVAENEQGTAQYTRHGVMEFVVDGVIVLYNIRKENVRVSALEILKMRGTKHYKALVPFNIDKGIVVFPQEQVFATNNF